MIRAIFDKAPQYIAAFATLWGTLYATGTLEDLGLATGRGDMNMVDISEWTNFSEGGAEGPPPLAFTGGPIIDNPDPIAIVGGVILSFVLAFFAYMLVRRLRNR